MGALVSTFQSSSESEEPGQMVGGLHAQMEGLCVFVFVCGECVDRLEISEMVWPKTFDLSHVRMHVYMLAADILELLA